MKYNPAKPLNTAVLVILVVLLLPVVVLLGGIYPLFGSRQQL
ncbi:MAG: hypothetical protein WCY61_03970 [Sphaerochaeta sp.]